MHIIETTVSDKRAQLESLLERHWQEVALNKDVMVLKPDWDKYRALEEAGALFSLVAYDGEQIVGYAVNFIHQHLHYVDLCMVGNDVLFVHPEYRGSCGRRLIAATEQAAKAKGAQMILWHGKQNTAFEALLPRLGYQVQDIIFSKRI